MQEREIRSLRRAPAFEVLDEGSLEAVREATFEVLERTGIEIRSDRLLKELDSAGADVDLAGGRARFPRKLVLDALAQTPAELTLHSREPGLDLLLDGSRGYLGVDGCAAEVADLQTGERRSSTKEDLATFTRLADAIPQLSYVWQPVSARDVPTTSEPLHDLEAQLAATGKHIMLMTAVSGDQARACVEMATVAAGGEAAFAARPPISSFQCSISPLTFDEGPLEAAVAFAKAGVASGFMVMPIAAATGPATATGTLVLSNSEVLAGIVALQLLAPGAATFYGSCATTMDLRSGAATCGGAEDLLFQIASSQLARSYGLKSCIGTFATGAKSSDWQAGTENALSLISSWLGGADTLSGAGLQYAARVFSPTQMLLDAELFELIARISEGFPTEDEDLAVEVIGAVGPGGHFLAHKHTRETMRRLWRSTYLSRESWEDWEAAGRPCPTDRAREHARQILDSHEPYPLPDGAPAEIRKVIDDFER